MEGIKKKRKKSYIQPKYNEKNPTVIAIRKYEQEILELEKKRAEATASEDWSMRNWYSNQINAKEKNMNLLKEKLGNKSSLKFLSDDW